MHSGRNRTNNHPLSFRIQPRRSELLARVQFSQTSTKMNAKMNSSAKTTGLRYWMLRVLDECEKVSADFSADPVHDLRVALRRCRSMADGMIAMDPDRNWKAMKKGGKQLFQRLGALRDVQIIMEWIDKLHLAAEPGSAFNGPQDARIETASGTPSVGTITEEILNPTQALLRILQTREAEEKHEARAALAH